MLSTTVAPMDTEQRPCQSSPRLYDYGVRFVNISDQALAENLYNLVLWW